ncbi:hypothetical protein FF011L_49240 [Roseimaritima multifibrata]|uniref:PHP domain protein n=1 Tax=Roseimaritima multifibrata TaxID=1930274 RepID=A0A517MMV9_9BACT|nr:CehA/McbA family metallohydrolase [Roseimaritima multifibrata]QDS96117.1 hypothetical protein FF011L_49240 [Roseimaritima multifibrata]
MPMRFLLLVSSSRHVWQVYGLSKNVLKAAGMVAAIIVVCMPKSQGIASELHHLRSGDEGEWDSFPENAPQRKLIQSFNAAPNDSDRSLRLRQQDVKEGWEVVLNDNRLGRLTRDENDMVVYFSVDAGVLKAKNTIVVQPIGNHKASDDIRVGEITLLDLPRSGALSQSGLRIQLLDDGKPSPGRITILDEDGAMVSIGTGSSDHLAIRPGTVYTSTGDANIELPAGTYELIAGRGPEYSIARAEIELAEGDQAEVSLSIHRTVNTSGWVACDTHVHTFTHSRHGDATVAERMVTLAGEGIELPIATDHNRHIDYEPSSREANVRQFFTPVIGNEVTTKTAHINIFPVDSGAPLPPHQHADWKSTFEGIFKTPGVRVAILNHARDVHNGTKPFGPKHFNEAAGEMLDDWHVGFNAMEVVNSGATKIDPLQLIRDWMTLLNRGRRITPVGSSDSHDVSRYIVGQGRTYIRCDDSRPDNIDVDAAVDAFLTGKVMVSYGLITEMRVNDIAQSGDQITVSEDNIKADITVRGPDWVSADALQLFANGVLVKELPIDSRKRSDFPTGQIYRTTIELPRPVHDVHLVAVATGPGIDGLHWKTAKPYQPDSPVWISRTIGCSGAIHVDADGDGQWQSAHDYANRIVDKFGDRLPANVTALESFDEAVAIQTALFLHAAGTPPMELLDRDLLSSASAATKRGFMAYVTAWRRNQFARVE